MGDFSGSWMCSGTENMEEFMKAVGMSWMMRKAAAGFSFGVGKQSLRVTGGSPGSADVTIVTKDPTGKETTVALKTDGVGFKMEGPFGGSGEAKATWEGDAMVQTFTKEGDGQVINFRRQLVGDKLEVTLSTQGITAKRIYSSSSLQNPFPAHDSPNSLSAGNLAAE
eukprot:CAMPEP_0177720594 /NCGR_PEP_ID=MMETSP0484_2-20121128/16700_1 /TAXON_ID=354590 /ORGANISM="Rhodomonas lens, Strain RHODO" /LENGTH=166 /DNA_ID=CAMNT_0019232849 /DNA_START=8 /DNA_END=509 /DNA_ORIENTATION=+